MLYNAFAMEKRNENVENSAFKNFMFENIKRMYLKKEWKEWELIFNAKEIDLSNLFWEVIYNERTKKSDHLLIKYITDYLFYINNRVVNSIEYFANYLRESIKQNDINIRKLTARKKNDKVIELKNKNKTLKSIKGKVLVFLEFDKSNPHSKSYNTFRKEYITHYFVEGESKKEIDYHLSFFYFFTKILLKNEREIIIDYLSNFLFIEKYYLDKRFIKDFFILNRLRNLLKIKLEIFSKTNDEKFINKFNEFKKDNNFFDLANIIFTYIDFDLAKKFELQIYSFFKNYIYKNESGDFFAKWNNIWNVYYEKNSNSNYKLSYDIKKTNVFMKEISYKGINKSDIFEEKVVGKKEKVNLHIKDILFSQYKLKLEKIFKITNLRKSKSYNNAIFYDNIIKYFINISNTKIKEIENPVDLNQSTKKKFIIIFTQFVNIFSFDEKNNTKFVDNFPYKNIDDFKMVRYFNLDFSQLFLKYLIVFNFFNNKAFDEIMNSFKHGSSLLSKSFSQYEEEIIKEKENGKENFNLFFSFINSLIKEMDKFKITSPLNYSNTLSENIKDSVLAKIHKEISKKGIVNKKNFKKFIEETFRVKPNKEGTFNKLLFSTEKEQSDNIKNFVPQKYELFFSYFVFLYLYALSQYKGIQNRESDVSPTSRYIKTNLINYVQEFQKLCNKYHSFKVKIISAYDSNFLWSLKQDTLLNYVKFVGKNFADLNEHNVDLKMDELSKKIKENISQMINIKAGLDFKEILINIDKFELSSNNIKSIIEQRKLIESDELIKSKLKNKDPLLLNLENGNINKYGEIFKEFKTNLNKFKNLEVRKRLFDIKTLCKISITKDDLNGYQYFIEGKNIVNDLYKNSDNDEINKLKKMIKELIEKNGFYIVSEKEKKNIDLYENLINKNNEILPLNSNAQKLLREILDVSKTLNYINKWWFEFIDNKSEEDYHKNLKLEDLLKNFEARSNIKIS